MTAREKMKIEKITVAEAQVYLWFEHYIMGKSYKQISQETDISKTTVGEIINCKYKRLYANTEMRLWLWKQKWVWKQKDTEDLKKCQKVYDLFQKQNKYVKPNLWQLILKFLGVRK